ncbi:MAG TPA: hypothetical protein VIB39_00090 [Candidatus Angelobacter sp.]
MVAQAGEQSLDEFPVTKNVPNSTEAQVPTVVAFQHPPQQYLVIAPDGNQIEIPKELFGLLWDFTLGNKPTGSVVIQFRNGGIAGLEAVIKKTYR